MFRFRGRTGSSRLPCEEPQRKGVLPPSRIARVAVEAGQRQPPHLRKGGTVSPHLGPRAWRYSETRPAEAPDEDREDGGLCSVRIRPERRRPTQTARRLVEASVSEKTRRAYARALRRLDARLDRHELHDATLAAHRTARCRPRLVERLDGGRRGVLPREVTDGDRGRLDLPAVLATRLPAEAARPRRRFRDGGPQARRVDSVDRGTACYSWNSWRECSAARGAPCAGRRRGCDRPQRILVTVRRSKTNR